MKTISFILFFIPALLLAQTQVSDIYLEKVRSNNNKIGFMKVGADEYLIEQGTYATNVSLVKGDSLIFMRSIKHRPSDSVLKRSSFDEYQNNSGLYYSGSVLYEIYAHYIYAVDILTGELVEKTDLAPLNLVLSSGFHFGENYFLFLEGTSNPKFHVRLDRQSREVTALPEGGVQINKRWYWIEDSTQSIVFLDLESNKKYDVMHTFHQISSIKSNDSDIGTDLIIQDADGVHLLNSNGVVKSIHCLLPDSSSILFASDTRIAYIHQSEINPAFKVLNLEDCAVEYTLADERASNFNVYSNTSIFNEYFIFGLPNDWQGDGQFYVFNLKTNTARSVYLPVDELYMNQSVLYGDHLYVNTINHLHYLGFFLELYRVDLPAARVKRINDREIYTTTNLIIGESQEDQELNIYYQFREGATVKQSNNDDVELKTLSEFDFKRNVGIDTKIYADIWVDDTYYFSASKAVYFMDGQTTTKLLDIGPNASLSSAFKQYGNHVFTMVNVDASYYALKINTLDQSYTLTLIPGFEQLSSNRQTSMNAILNLHSNNSNAASNGFFDVETESFVTMGSFGFSAATRYNLSGNNLIYRLNNSQGNYWFMINTLTRKVRLTDIPPGTFIGSYADDTGGFYLTSFLLDDYRSFCYLDQNGKIATVFQDFDLPVFTNGNRFSGKVKSLAFDGDSSVVIVSTREGEAVKKVIPDHGLQYYQKFFWYESDEVSFIETYNGSNYDTYYFTFETEPKNIVAGGRYDRLVAVCEQENYSLLTYRDGQNKLIFEKYDYETGTMTTSNMVESNILANISDFTMPVNDEYFLIGLDDGIYGLEPWLINTNTGQLTFLRDIFSGFGSSAMGDLTRNPNTSDIYFTAVKTEGDRQLFRLDHQLLSLEEVPLYDSESILVFPNPADRSIRLSGEFKEIYIVDSRGNLRLRNSGHNSNAISVESFESGLFYIYGLTKDGNRQSGKFVVQR